MNEFWWWYGSWFCKYYLPYGLLILLT